MSARLRRVRLAAVALLIAGALAPRQAPAGVTPFSLVEATIDDIQAAILAGEVSCVDVVTRYLHRIAAYNGTCVDQPDGLLGFITPIADAGQINALMTLNLRPATRQQFGFDARKARSLTDLIDDDPALPDALETAAALDAHRLATGELIGPLHCVVMSIKDQFDTVDMRTTSGMDAFYADDRPPDDASFIAKLRAAGAIILAKANQGEMASASSRSSFGGVLCNPYDTLRTPGHSSGGSAASVAANLVTCSIGEETGGSILHPVKNNNVVGLVPTQEIMTRDGMIDAGLNTRAGPFCRTVEDTAKIFDVIAGYDPKDEFTAFAVGRMPPQPYPTYARATSLAGLRIGVIREYMDGTLWNEADVESLAIQEAAVQQLAALGATLVDPGPQGYLFQDCVDQYAPLYRNALFVAQFPALFPAGTDQIPYFVDAWFTPSLVPEPPGGPTIRGIGGASTAGFSKFSLTRYLRERGDAEIQTVQDLVDKANFWTDIRADANFGNRKNSMQNTANATSLDFVNFFMNRHAYRVIVLNCMAQLGLDAMVSSGGTIPAYVLGQPVEPTLNNRGPSVITVLGQQGFPMLGVPAGFTSYVYDRVRDASAPGGTKLVGPVPAVLPVAITLYARPFDEPTLFTIASAFEAATDHRMPPPAFGPLPGEP